MAKVASSGFDAALEYARKHTLHALLVATRKETLLETYESGYRADLPHPLYSGTKSFWGLAASAAQDDGILDLDESAADTLVEWRNDAWKRTITVRQLLTMSAGFPFGGLGAAVPAFDAAIAVPLRDRPGTAFTYSGIPWQAFGAFFSRRLASRGESPLEYLQRRILTPIGLRKVPWRTLHDGTHTLPTGAQLTARDWLKYGRLILGEGRFDTAHIVSPAAVRRCLAPSAANPRYGLGFWLASDNAGTDIAYASGAGGQGLYIVPARDTVVVHYGKSNSFKHDAFLRRLLGIRVQAPRVDRRGAHGADLEIPLL